MSTGHKPVWRRGWVKILFLGGLGSTLGAMAFAGLVFVVILGLLGASPTSATSAYPSGFGAPPVTPRHGRVTDAQAQFAGSLVACSGLSPDVALGWIVAEGGGVNPGQPANNFLFLTAATGGFRDFPTPQDAATAVCQTLQAKDYAGILASAGQSATLQLLAIAESPWDGGHVAWGDPAGHYGGSGQNLVGAYYSLMGDTSCQRTSQPC